MKNDLNTVFSRASYYYRIFNIFNWANGEIGFFQMLWRVLVIGTLITFIPLFLYIVWLMFLVGFYPFLSYSFGYVAGKDVNFHDTLSCYYEKDQAACDRESLRRDAKGYYLLKQKQEYIKHNHTEWADGSKD